MGVELWSPYVGKYSLVGGDCAACAARVAHRVALVGDRWLLQKVHQEQSLANNALFGAVCLVDTFGCALDLGTINLIDN